MRCVRHIYEMYETHLQKFFLRGPTVGFLLELLYLTVPPLDREGQLICATLLLPSHCVLQHTDTHTRHCVATNMPTHSVYLGNISHRLKAQNRAQEIAEVTLEITSLREERSLRKRGRSSFLLSSLLFCSLVASFLPLFLISLILSLYFALNSSFKSSLDRPFHIILCLLLSCFQLDLL